MGVDGYSEGECSYLNERVLVAALGLALSRPRLVLLCWLLVVVALAPAVMTLEISTSTDDVLDRSGADWDFYQESVRQFGGDEVLVVALHSPVPFAPEILNAIPELTAKLEEIQGVRRVDSLSTVPVTRMGEQGGLVLSAPLADSIPNDEDALREFRRLVLGDRIAAGALLSDDGRVFSINVHVEGGEGQDFDRIVTLVREAASGHNAWISGVPVFRAEINRRAGAEIAAFVVMTVAIVGVVVFLVIRSLPAVFLLLGTGAIGTWVTLAGLGASGTALTLITVILPSLMLAFGCAYSIHLLVAARGAATLGEIESALLPVLRPTLLSGLTTAIGFLAVSTVRIDAVSQVGTYGALGSLATVCAAISVVPAALALYPLLTPPTRGERWLRSRLPEAIYSMSTRHGSRLVFVWFAISLAVGSGIGFLRVETDAARWFETGSEVRDSYEAIRSRLAGISPMNVVVEGVDGFALDTPGVLRSLAQFTDFANDLPGMGKAISIADPVIEIHREFARPSEGTLPASREAVSQYLLLLESFDYVRDLLRADHLVANVPLRVDENGSERLLAIADELEGWWRDNGPPGTKARTTGIMFEFARAEDEIARGQVRGLAVAMAAIVVLLVAIYRDVRIGLIALVPNVLPLILMFGFLGWVGIPLDAGMVVSACLVLGIGVDDTIHLVSAREHWQHTGGRERGAALACALRQVVLPLVLTTAAIGLGFAVLASSSFAFVRNLGLVVVGVMVVCLLADTALLPALLYRRSGSGWR